jgi:glycosyltransferase involved in cell wall biosynthesis
VLKVTQYYATALNGDFGTARSVRGWCEGLASAGANVRLVVDGDAIRLPPPKGVECVPMAHVLRGRRRIPAKLEPLTGQADVVILHGGWTVDNLVVGAWAARKGIPYVVTAHGVYNARVLGRRKVALKRAWNALLERRHLSRALAVHCFFREERDDLERLGVLPSMVVAPTGFAPPAGLKWKGGGGYLLWLGRYDPECKGLDLLLEALHLLPANERPPLRLHGPDWHGKKRSVADLNVKLGLEEWVTVGEAIYGEEKSRLLEDATGFVYPSRWDACPTAILESASSGIPTLVTPYPLGNLLASRGGAVLAEATAESVAAGLKRILSSEAPEVGRKGAVVVRESLSWHVVARSWLEQVEALLADRATSS